MLKLLLHPTWMLTVLFHPYLVRWKSHRRKRRELLVVRQQPQVWKKRMVKWRDAARRGDACHLPSKASATMRSSESAEELIEICDLLAARDEEGCRVERTTECAHKKAKNLRDTSQ